MRKNSDDAGCPNHWGNLRDIRFEENGTRKKTNMGEVTPKKGGSGCSKKVKKGKRRKVRRDHVFPNQSPSVEPKPGWPKTIKGQGPIRKKKTGGERNPDVQQIE